MSFDPYGGRYEKAIMHQTNYIRYIYEYLILFYIFNSGLHLTPVNVLILAYILLHLVAITVG